MIRLPLALIFISGSLIAQEKNVQNKVLDGVYVDLTDSNRYSYYANGIVKMKDFNFTTYEDISEPYSKKLEKSLSLDNCVYVDPGFALRKTENGYQKKYGLGVPNSIRFSVDASQCETSASCNLMTLKEGTLLPSEEYLTPFYFKNSEVTNYEYKEFVNWVRDSIGRTELGLLDANGFVDWASEVDFDSDDIKKKLTSIYEQDSIGKYQLKKDVISYAIQNPESSVKSYLRIYPDEEVWVKDFNAAYNQPMTDLYFFHPAYDNYPVVGVSFYQAQAYLNWLTKQQNKTLKREGETYTCSYELPTEVQWEMMASAGKRDKQVIVYKHIHSVEDQSWMTDLSLTSEFRNSNELRRPNLVDSYRRKEFGSMNLLIDHVMFTNKVDMNTKYVKPDEVGIYGMAGNVSEWIDESFDDQWLPMYKKHQESLSYLSGADVDLMRSIEDYFLGRNDKGGMMIRGGNWYDKRYSFIGDKNVAGMRPKAFKDPNKSFSTVGFRYVVKVYRAELI